MIRDRRGVPEDRDLRARRRRRARRSSRRRCGSSLASGRPADGDHADAIRSISAPSTGSRVGAELAQGRGRSRRSSSDAWTTARDVVLGAAWVRRTGDDKLEALSAVCPHLGCAVGWDGSDELPVPVPRQPVRTDDGELSRHRPGQARARSAADRGQGRPAAPDLGSLQARHGDAGAGMKLRAGCASALGASATRPATVPAGRRSRTCSAGCS